MTVGTNLDGACEVDVFSPNNICRLIGRGIQEDEQDNGFLMLTLQGDLKDAAGKLILPIGTKLSGQLEKVVLSREEDGDATASLFALATMLQPGKPPSYQRVTAIIEKPVSGKARFTVSMLDYFTKKPLLLGTLEIAKIAKFALIIP